MQAGASKGEIEFLWKREPHFPGSRVPFSGFRGIVGHLWKQALIPGVIKIAPLRPVVRAAPASPAKDYLQSSKSLRSRLAVALGRNLEPKHCVFEL